MPLAEAVNAIAVRGIKPPDVNITREVLLAIIANLAQDELERDLPMPSTRALKHVGSARRRKRA